MIWNAIKINQSINQFAIITYINKHHNIVYIFLIYPTSYQVRFDIKDLSDLTPSQIWYKVILMWDPRTNQGICVAITKILDSFSIPLLGQLGH